jgi:hypothetical protein
MTTYVSVKSYTTRAAQLTRLIRRARTEATVMLARYRVSSDPAQALRASWLRRRHDALVAAGWSMVDGDRWIL